jgi:putative ATPase
MKRPRVAATPDGTAAQSWEKIGLGAKPQHVLDDSERPLAERVRPTSLDDIVGQPRAVAKLRRCVRNKTFCSLIFYGPPGCGKTTAARIVARMSNIEVVALSAVTAGVKDVRESVAKAQRTQRGIVLFVDEVHRFNKAQQDAFLPHVESGLIKLIGATTENPSFALNNALLSRCQVIEFTKLSAVDAIVPMLQRALNIAFPDVAVGGSSSSSAEEAAEAAALTTGTSAVASSPLQLLAALADGDGRVALNSLELAANEALLGAPPHTLTARIVSSCVERAQALSDRKGDQHYQLISALHKSMRGSNVSASLYYLARQLEGGEDPRYIARRMQRFAVEDVGLADPHALPLAVETFSTCATMGSPESDLVLANCCAYLTRAPKSIAVYEAYSEAQRVVKQCGRPPVPKHLCNADTGMMKSLGYGTGYVYVPHHKGPMPEGYHYMPKALAEFESGDRAIWRTRIPS